MHYTEKEKSSAFNSNPRITLSSQPSSFNGVTLRMVTPGAHSTKDDDPYAAAEIANVKEIQRGSALRQGVARNESKCRLPNRITDYVHIGKHTARQIRIRKTRSPAHEAESTIDDENDRQDGSCATVDNDEERNSSENNDNHMDKNLHKRNASAGNGGIDLRGRMDGRHQEKVIRYRMTQEDKVAKM